VRFDGLSIRHVFASVKRKRKYICANALDRFNCPVHYGFTKTQEAIMKRAKPEFEKYWRSLDAKGKERLARKAKTSVAYLSSIAHGHRKPGWNVIQRVIAADKALTFEMLRAWP
jgi:hypothetical protein